MIKNVIFDMGGVIVDVHRDRAVRNFMAIGVHDADQLSFKSILHKMEQIGGMKYRHF